jgi:hypothetical protein
LQAKKKSDKETTGQVEEVKTTWFDDSSLILLHFVKFYEMQRNAL